MRTPGADTLLGTTWASEALLGTPAHTAGPSAAEPFARLSPAAFLLGMSLTAGF